MEANKYLRIGVWLFQWLFLCSLSFWHFVRRTVCYKRDYVRFHANLGKILKITGINYGPSPFLLQPISSVPTFGKSTYPLFCPCLSVLGREVAQSRMGDHLQGSARSRTLPLTFFFKEKRYLDPSYLINYSNSPFYSVPINTA